MASRNRKRNVTIIDVAREANVSYSTVSRVVNNNPHVREDKRERVREAMAKLGYVANPLARGLAGGQAQVIGLLVRDLVTEDVAQILLGIDEELATHQYDLMLYTTHHRRAKESQYIQTLTQGFIDGLLLILPLDPGAYLETLRRHQFPYVVIDHQGFDDFSPTVVSTNTRGAYEATEYLIKLGHRRIAFIAGSENTSSAIERLEGYRAALQAHDLPFDPALVQSGEFDQPGGFHAAQKLLSLPERPTAIFAANDASAIGAMDAIRSHGLSIPGDVSIIGFDDIRQSAYCYPPLTTVRQPLIDMGRIATRLLMTYIANPAHPRERVVMNTELVIRESCAPPRSAGQA